MGWLLHDYILNCSIFFVIYLSFYYFCITTGVERFAWPIRIKFGMCTWGRYGMVII